MLSFVAVAVRPTAEAIPNPTSFSPFYIPIIMMIFAVYSFALLILVAPDVLALGGRRSPAGRSSVAAGGMTPEEIDYVIKKLEAALARGVYRNPELTLNGLAECLSVHPKRLSIAINNHYGEGCSRLLNRYRLDEFLSRADAAALAHQSILSLPFEVGFPSKSTFNRVFRERFDVAPSKHLPNGSK